MDTPFHRELSKNNPYYIPRERYYELKYFCLQYPVWKKAYESLSSLSGRPYDLEHVQKSGISNPTASCAEAKAHFSSLMKMVWDAAEETDKVVGQYILDGVTKGMSYDALNTNSPVPCSRVEYYALCRKFFWILSGKRG